MAYDVGSVTSLIDNLNNLRADKVVDNVDLSTIVAGTKDEVVARINAVLARVITAVPYGAAAGGQDLFTLINGIMNGDVIPYKSSMIVNVPTSKELVSRLITPLWMTSKGLPMNNETAAITGNTYSHIPASDYDMWYSSLALDANQKTNLSKWDELVKKIRDKLSGSIAGATSSEIPPGNAVAQPKKSTITVFNRNPAVAAMLPAIRNNVINVPTPANPLAGFRVALQNGGNFNMKGGNVSRAAPLYPTLVMNGGASPFAVMEGGAAAAAWPADRQVPNPVAILDAKINASVNGFKAATGADLQAGLRNDIRSYSDNTNNALKDLSDKLKLLDDSSKAFSQYRPGLGVDAGNMTAEQLKTMVDQIKEVNDAAEKASKKYSKLEEISKTLDELVARGRGVGRNP
jgi:hypothetical protein